MLTVPLFINDEEILTSKTLDVYSPSTGQLVHKAASASIDDARAAVEAAQAAFPSWAATPPAKKRDIFLNAAAILAARAEEAGKAESEESGAPSSFSAGFDVVGAVDLLKDVAGRVATIEGSLPHGLDPTRAAMVVKEPFGVVLAIAPWNAIFILGIRSVVYALAAGNTVVLKASELSPRSFSLIGQIFKEAGLPAGALNIIQHHPEDAAAITKSLIDHPAIKKVNFTGSTAVGRIIAKLCGENLKPCLMELGGKAPAIVLADADLKLAAQACTLGAFLNSGQICMSTERILVEKSVSAAFASELKGAIAGIFPAKQEALVLMTGVAVKKNKALLANAKSKGAEILYGDINAEEASAERMRPVVVKGVTKEMDLYYTESFGPTVSFIEVESEEEAIAIANDTEYGLSSSVFTRDLQKGLRIAARIESGAVHINAMSVHDEAGFPHGGVKASGWGRFGSCGLDEWVKTKTITFAK